jgi:CBS domain-containing protein
MQVSEIMTRDVCIARPDHTIEDAARMMLAIDAGLLPVGDDDRLVGTVTDRDIAVRAIAEGILSLADLAQAERGQRVGNALRQIAQPGGEHTQGANERSGGM